MQTRIQSLLMSPTQRGVKTVRLPNKLEAIKVEQPLNEFDVSIPERIQPDRLSKEEIFPKQTTKVAPIESKHRNITELLASSVKGISFTKKAS